MVVEAGPYSTPTLSEAPATASFAVFSKFAIPVGGAQWPLGYTLGYLLGERTIAEPVIGRRWF